MVGFTSRDQRSGRVQQDYISTRGFLPAQDRSNDPGIFDCVAARDVGESGAGHAELLGRYLVGTHRSSPSLSHASGTSTRDLIEAIEAVYYQSPVQAKHAQSLRQFL